MARVTHSDQEDKLAATVLEVRWLTLEQWALVFELAENAIMALAIVVGGIWTYLLFIKHRERYPRATIEHIVQHRCLTDSHTLLRIEMRVSNTGKVLMPLAQGFVRAHTILPCDNQTLESLVCRKDETECYNPPEGVWPLIGQANIPEGPHELEPGESENFPFDFVIGREVQCICIYSYLSNRKKSKGKHEIGWSTSTIHDLATNNTNEESHPRRKE